MTSLESAALQSILRVWNASFNLSAIYNSATDRFKHCREVVATGAYPGSEVAHAISVGAFFDYKRSRGKSRSHGKIIRHALDSDFDDMGNKHEEAYRYEQKRKRGKF